MERLMRRGVVTILLASSLVACPRVLPPTPAPPRPEAPAAPASLSAIDPYTVDLIAFSEFLPTVTALSMQERWHHYDVLAWRAHDEALSIEAKGPPEQLEPAERLRLFRLHLLAIELIEYVSDPPPPNFVAPVDGSLVGLQDLRAAQLARLDPSLLQDTNGTVTLRRPQFEFFLREMEKRPAWAEGEPVLALMRTPRE